MRGVRTHLLDHSDQHAAGTGDRVVHLAAGTNDLGNLGAHGSTVTTVLVGQLAETGGVEVESAHSHADLPCAQRRVGVELPRGLREHAHGLQDTVETDGAHRVGAHERDPS